MNNYINTKNQEVELNKTYIPPKGSFTSESMKYMNQQEKCLFYFAAGSNIAGLRFLLINGAHINTLDEERTSSLHIACRKGSLQMIEEIINQGAMVDIPDLAGWTSLHISCYFKRSECILLLLKNHANLLTRNRNSDCPFDLVYDDIKCIEVIGNFVQENHTFDNSISNRIESLMFYEDFYNTELNNTNKQNNKFYDKNVIEQLYKVYYQKKKYQKSICEQNNLNIINASSHSNLLNKIPCGNEDSNSGIQTFNALPSPKYSAENKIFIGSKDDNEEYKKEVFNVLDLKQKITDMYKIIPKKHTFFLEYNKCKQEEYQLIKKLKTDDNLYERNERNNKELQLNNDKQKNKDSDQNENQNKNSKYSVKLKANNNISNENNNRLLTNVKEDDCFEKNALESEICNYDTEKNKTDNLNLNTKSLSIDLKTSNNKYSIKSKADKFGGINIRKETQLKGIVSKNLESVKEHVQMVSNNNRFNNIPTILNSNSNNKTDKEFEMKRNTKKDQKSKEIEENKQKIKHIEHLLEAKDKDKTSPKKEKVMEENNMKYSSKNNYQTEIKLTPTSNPLPNQNQNSHEKARANGVKIPNVFPDTKNILKVSYNNIENQYIYTNNGKKSLFIFSLFTFKMNTILI